MVKRNKHCLFKLDDFFEKKYKEILPMSDGDTRIAYTKDARERLQKA